MKDMIGRISKFVTLPNVRKNIAEAKMTSERRVAFTRGLFVGLSVACGLAYAVMAAVILSDVVHLDSDMWLAIAGALFVILSLGFLNLAFASRSHFDDMVEIEEIKRSHKAKREESISSPEE